MANLAVDSEQVIAGYFIRAAKVAIASYLFRKRSKFPSGGLLTGV